MEFANLLIKGTLLKRYKRFLADVQLEDGRVVIAHCPNTGAMTGCAEPGFEVWLSESNNPKRKLAYTWELAVNQHGHWIGINTNNANKLVAEALAENVLPELQGYGQIRSEVKYGQENSRIDFLLQDSTSDEIKPDCYVEVKSVTLLQNKLGMFPDAKTARGQKHLRELAEVAKQGNRAVLLYCVQHTGIKDVKVAEHIDPKYAQELEEAILNGLQVLCYSVKITKEKTFINQRIPFLK